MHTNKLYVGNLAYDVTYQELEELFAEHGTVVHTKVIEGKGFGFVEMSNQEDAENVKEKLDGYEFKGRQLKVAEARPQREQHGGGGGGGRRGGGGGGGRGNFGGDRRY